MLPTFTTMSPFFHILQGRPARDGFIFLEECTDKGGGNRQCVGRIVVDGKENIENILPNMHMLPYI